MIATIGWILFGVLALGAVVVYVWQPNQTQPDTDGETTEDTPEVVEQ